MRDINKNLSIKVVVFEKSLQLSYGITSTLLTSKKLNKHMENIIKEHAFLQLFRHVRSVKRTSLLLL